MKATTVITVHAVVDGKIIASATNTLQGYRKMEELAYSIGYATQDAAEQASYLHNGAYDMCLPNCYFKVEIAHLYDGHR